MRPTLRVSDPVLPSPAPSRTGVAISAAVGYGYQRNADSDRVISTSLPLCPVGRLYALLNELKLSQYIRLDAFRRARCASGRPQPNNFEVPACTT